MDARRGGRAVCRSCARHAGIGTRTCRLDSQERIRYPKFLAWAHHSYTGRASVEYEQYTGYSLNGFWEITAVNAGVLTSNVLTADVWLEVDSVDTTTNTESDLYTCTVLKSNAAGATVDAGCGVASYENTREQPWPLGYIYAVANDQHSPRIEWGRIGAEPWANPIEDEYPQIIIGRRDDVSTITDSQEPGILIAQNGYDKTLGYLLADATEFTIRNVTLESGPSEGVNTFRLYPQGRLEIGTNIDEVGGRQFEFDPGQGTLMLSDIFLSMVDNGTPFFEIGKTHGLDYWIDPQWGSEYAPSLPQFIDRVDQLTFLSGGNNFQDFRFEKEMLSIGAQQFYLGEETSSQGPGSTLAEAHFLVNHESAFDDARLFISTGYPTALQSATITMSRINDVPEVKIQARYGATKIDSRIYWTNWRETATGIGEMYVDGSGYLRIKTT